MNRMFFNLGNTHPDLEHLRGVEALATEYDRCRYVVYFLSGEIVSGVYPKSALSFGWPSLKRKVPTKKPEKKPDYYCLLWNQGENLVEAEIVSKAHLEASLNSSYDPPHFLNAFMKGQVQIGQVTLIQPVKKAIERDILCVD